VVTVLNDSKIGDTLNCSYRVKGIGEVGVETSTEEVDTRDCRDLVVQYRDESVKRRFILLSYLMEFVSVHLMIPEHVDNRFLATLSPNAVEELGKRSWISMNISSEDENISRRSDLKMLS
jgi:hypothetical protein